MNQISSINIDTSINTVVRRLSPDSGIRELYPHQRKLLHEFYKEQDIFYTESTNAGKTLPPCLFPYLVEDLRKTKFLDLPLHPKCLMITALNSIRGSLTQKMLSLGLDAEIVTQQNVKEVLRLERVKIFFLSPELLKNDAVFQTLLSVKKDFVIKCVDEAHLFLSWGIDKKGRKAFRPAMQLSTGELSSLGGITLLQTATATCKTIRILQEEFPEISKWRKIINVPFRENITLIIPPTGVISSKFQITLEPFIKRMLDFDESHLILVRSINTGTEIYFHLLKRLGRASDGKRAVAFFHRKYSE